MFQFFHDKWKLMKKIRIKTVLNLSWTRERRLWARLSRSIVSKMFSHNLSILGSPILCGSMPSSFISSSSIPSMPYLDMFRLYQKEYKQLEKYDWINSKTSLIQKKSESICAHWPIAILQLFWILSSNLHKIYVCRIISRLLGSSLSFSFYFVIQ